jgi:hypothetical protein
MKSYDTIASNPYDNRETEAEKIARNVAETGDEARLSPPERLDLVRDEFYQLVHRLKPGIQTGRWSSLIIEGISAQPVGMVIGSIMKRWAQEHDQNPPSTMVITLNKASSENENSTEVYEYLSGQVTSLTTKRTLVLTEYIHRGIAIGNLEGMLTGIGASYDIATLVGDEERYLEEGSQYYSGGSRYIGDCPLYASPDGRPALRRAVGYDKEGTSPIPVRVTEPDPNFIKSLDTLTDNLYEDLF